MTSKILNTAIDCARPYELATFWSSVLGRPIHPDNEAADEEVGISLEPGGELLFQAVPERKANPGRTRVGGARRSRGK